MTVTYEWDVETWGAEECLEHNHDDRLNERMRKALADTSNGETRLVLVRDDDTGRAWAYVKDGALPEYFTDAYECETTVVPKRFHEELARWLDMADA